MHKIFILLVWSCLVLSNYSTHAMQGFPGYLNPQEERFLRPDAEADACPMCREIMVAPGAITISLCGHVIHTACINKWVRCGHTTCPMCSMVLPEYQENQEDLQEDIEERGFLFWLQEIKRDAVYFCNAPGKKKASIVAKVGLVLALFRYLTAYHPIR